MTSHRIIKSGGRFVFFSEGITSFNELPVATYAVRFDPKQGFYLEQVSDLEPNPEEKIYGPHVKKAEKIINRFNASNRSIGAIFSGGKGIGKSLTVKVLSQLASKENLPTLIVSSDEPGIVPFIEGIGQSCLYVFDEFEKNFYASRGRARELDVTYQEDLLPLFDGLSSTKNIWALTANDAHSISPFLMARPGRIHYHIRYEELDIETITEFLKDNITSTKHQVTIPRIASHCSRNMYTFDKLRALCFELNCSDEDFEDLVADMNLSETGMTSDLDIYLRLTSKDKDIEIKVEGLYDSFTSRLLVRDYTSVDSPWGRISFVNFDGQVIVTVSTSHEIEFNEIIEGYSFNVEIEDEEPSEEIKVVSGKIIMPKSQNNKVMF